MHLIHLFSTAHLQMYKWNIAKRRCKSKVFVRAEEILETEEAKAGGKLSNSVCLFCSTKSQTDWKLEIQNFILNPSKAVSWHWFSLSFVTLVLSQWPHGTTAPCMLGGFFKVCLGLLCYTQDLNSKYNMDFCNDQPDPTILLHCLCFVSNL